MVHERDMEHVGARMKVKEGSSVGELKGRGRAAERYQNEVPGHELKGCLYHITTFHDIIYTHRHQLTCATVLHTQPGTSQHLN